VNLHPDPHIPEEEENEEEEEEDNPNFSVG